MFRQVTFRACFVLGVVLLVVVQHTNALPCNVRNLEISNLRWPTKLLDLFQFEVVPWKNNGRISSIWVTAKKLPSLVHHLSRHRVNYTVDAMKLCLSSDDWTNVLHMSFLKCSWTHKPKKTIHRSRHQDKPQWSANSKYYLTGRSIRWKNGYENPDSLPIFQDNQKFPSCKEPMIFQHLNALIPDAPLCMASENQPCLLNNNYKAYTSVVSNIIFVDLEANKQFMLLANLSKISPEHRFAYSLVEMHDDALVYDREALFYIHNEEPPEFFYDRMVIRHIDGHVLSYGSPMTFLYQTPNEKIRQDGMRFDYSLNGKCDGIIATAFKPKNILERPCFRTPTSTDLNQALYLQRPTDLDGTGCDLLRIRHLFFPDTDSNFEFKHAVLPNEGIYVPIERRTIINDTPNNMSLNLEFTPHNSTPMAAKIDYMSLLPSDHFIVNTNFDRPNYASNVLDHFLNCDNSTIYQDEGRAYCSKMDISQTIKIDITVPPRTEIRIKAYQLNHEETVHEFYDTFSVNYKYQIVTKYNESSLLKEFHMIPTTQAKDIVEMLGVDPSFITENPHGVSARVGGKLQMSVWPRYSVDIGRRCNSSFPENLRF